MHDPGENIFSSIEAEKSWLLNRRTELLEAAAELRRINRRLAAIEALEQRRHAGLFDARESTRQRFTPDLRKSEILGVLQQEPGLRRADIARAIGLKPSQAGVLVNTLVDEGRVREGPNRRLFVKGARG